MARRTGSSLTIARALAAHCDAIAGPTYSATREDEAGEVVRRARQAGDRELELLGLRLRVVALLEQGRVREARTDMRTFARVAERLRQPLYSWYVWLWRGFEAHLVGDLAELGRCAAEVDRLGALAESRNAATLAFVQRIWIALEERREAEIMAETSAVMPELTELVPDGGPLMGLAAGQPEEVRRRVRDRVEELLPFIPDDAEHVPNLCHLAHGLWYAREPARCAAPVYRALLPYADQLSIDGIAAGTHGSVARYLGVLAALQGRFDDAELHLEHALAANTAADASLALAHTRWMYAEVLALRDRPGGRERRQALLRQARDDYERMGIPQRVDLVTALLATDVGPAIPRDRPTPLSGIFRSSGAVWHLAYRGEEATLPHVKGMTDLAVLLARPGEEVHALDLVASPRTGRKAAADEGTPGRPGDLGEVLDATAREAYRRRLSELADELAEADTVGDAAAAERAAAEREALVRELSAAYGIGGRPRRAGDPAERARTTVTWRIRDAIRRIGAEHETLGRHLRSSVRTGVFCSYVPEQDQRWET